MLGLQADIWTALPGVVVSFDPANQTCVVQPLIQGMVQAPDGSFSWVTLPLLLDCPVFFPSGGGVSLTFPISAGDECLVVFASRCIDQWWQSGEVSVQAELRMHDLSDGFVFPGIASKPAVFGNISTTHAQLRNAAGTVKVSVDTAGNLELAATTININGQLIINGQAYLAHRHSGVTSGGQNSGVVV